MIIRCWGCGRRAYLARYFGGWPLCGGCAAQIRKRRVLPDK